MTVPCASRMHRRKHEIQNDAKAFVNLLENAHPVLSRLFASYRVAPVPHVLPASSQTCAVAKVQEMMANVRLLR